MSRYIDHDKPYSDDDIEYLKTRSGGDYLIEVNETRFGSLSKKEAREASKQKDDDDQHDADELQQLEDEQGDPIPFDDDVIDRVEPLSYNQLRQAASKANLDAGGTKEELQDRLLNFYQDQKDGTNGVETVTE